MATKKSTRKNKTGKSSQATRRTRTTAKTRTTRRTPTKRARRESGMPGGGAGRREEAGGSGVYPASGPEPEENAPYHGMASWGQGERGAAGYEDSGRSELTRDVGQAPDEKERPMQEPVEKRRKGQSR